MIDAANTSALYHRFYSKRPKRGKIRVSWLTQAEYDSLSVTPHFGIATFWQSYQAGITQQNGLWYCCLRPFSIAGEYPGRILLLPKP